MAIISFNQCYLTLSSHAFITRTTGPDTIVDWLKFADFAKPCQNAPSSKDYEVLNLKLRDYEAEEQLVYLKRKSIKKILALNIPIPTLPSTTGIYKNICYNLIVEGTRLMRKSYSSREIIKIIRADGWYRVGIVGGHHQFKHPSKKGRVTIPHSKKALEDYEISSIQKQSGLKF